MSETKRGHRGHRPPRVLPSGLDGYGGLGRRSIANRGGFACLFHSLVFGSHHSSTAIGMVDGFKPAIRAKSYLF